MRYSPRVFFGLLLLAALVLAVPLVAAQQSGEGGQIDLPITETTSYTVDDDDTLESIAALFDVDVICLAEGNGLDASSIVRPGDVLLIEIECPNYTGDLEVLFPRESFTLPPDEEVEDEEAQPAATATPNVGSTAGSGSTGTTNQGGNAATATATPQDDEEGGVPVGAGQAGQSYVVQPRDTLDTIAQRFNVSLVSLRMANDLMDFNGSDLRPGVTLVIPTDGVPYGQFPAVINVSPNPDNTGGIPFTETYVVQPRDTLDTIAQQFNVSIISLRMVNDLMDFRGVDLRPGTVLAIPDDGVPYGQFPALTNASGDAGTAGANTGGIPLGSTTYIMQRGDTVDQVAAEYNVLTSCVLEANNITNARRVFPGQQIVIPSDCPPYAGGGVGLNATAATPTPGGS
ncbi:MAG: LysM peptidoglycan-binding domain-containing protein [bacterium]|nr:LysM peptidoglycan-binding domain-containing protein [bacterium]